MFAARWLAMDVTSADVKANCNDLKVLGKGDFKTLMKWRLALREEVGVSSPSLNGLAHNLQLGLDNRNKETEDIIEAAQVVEEVDEEQQITEEVSSH